MRNKKDYRIYYASSRIIPIWLRNKYAKLLDYSYINIAPEHYLGFILVFGLLLSLMLSLYLSLLFPWYFWFVFAVSFIAFELISYFWLALSVDKKALIVENVLPDALTLMSSNLRAGYTFDKAILLSSRPEFGPLAKEIETVGKKINAGIETTKALKEMSEHIRSVKLDKVTGLMITGIKGGGSMAPLLDEIAQNLRSQDTIEKRIRASISMYAIFIATVIAIGAPILFGESSYLVGVMSSKFSSIALPQLPKAGAMAMMPTIGMAMNPAIVTNFALACLITSSFFGSIILGLIIKGKERAGLKYFIPLMVASLSVFYIVKFILEKILSGMLI